MADNPLICEEILENYGNPDHIKLDNIIDPRIQTKKKSI